MIPGPLAQAALGFALQKAFGPDDDKEVQRKDTGQAGRGTGDAAPRCAVCGGPLEDGAGCEFCPRVFS